MYINFNDVLLIFIHSWKKNCFLLLVKLKDIHHGIEVTSKNNFAIK